MCQAGRLVCRAEGRKYQKQEEAVMADSLIGLKIAAQRLGVSEFTVRRRVKEGLVRSVRLGRRLLISESEVDRVIREGCAPAVAGAQCGNRP